MAQIRRALPGGKGLRTGENAYANQYESDDLRNALQPKAGGWILSPLGEAIYSSYDAVGATTTTNRIVFVYVPERTRIVRPAFARIGVNTAAAAATVKTALFVYQTAPQAQFYKLPGTEATFDASATGQKSVALLSAPDVLPDSRLFIGVWSSDGTVVLNGMTIGPAVGHAISRLRIDDALAFGPSYIIAAMTSSAATQTLPFAAYLSQTAATLI